MSNDIQVTVQQNTYNQVTVQEEDTFNVYTSLLNSAYVNSISDIGDVDTVSEGKLDGSVLVYKSATNKWTSTKLLNQQTVDAGEF